MTKKWEYCAIRANVSGGAMKLKFFSSGPDPEIRDISDVHTTMATLGEDGWELVTLTQISEPSARVYYLKRPLAQ